MITKKIARAVIRPPRAQYDESSIPHIAEVQGFGNVERISIAFPNSFGTLIYGSYYAAPEQYNPKTCIIYLHGNASNQLEGRYLVSLFVPVGINVFCFDFSGCGCSPGKYVSLGYFEKNDVRSVIDLLRTDFQIQKILLWGRSMGAAVTLMTIPENRFISAAVVDSPYCSLKDLFLQIAENEKVPKWVAKKAIKKARKAILKTAKFDIFDVNPIESCQMIQTPVFFIHGTDDDFVDKTNSERLFEAIDSPNKELHLVPGKHNDDRPTKVIMDATVFLCKAVGLEIEFNDDEEEENHQEQISQNSNQHFSNAASLMSSL
ncbi:Clan SC, family S9, unassigned serine peptidase [Histomonas meleagridis]|uniref:Clan SC, family S9, unassigned serine peptidase n=1 Tax=Histomonas meleagridis TaxID=135588 RepID=UPI0035598EA8|nr:Clan SC, family S9, unassigned serine peptidase [Histomonas meleagridis]KAH0801548.1 Clan SC, family S9, unassigned serine peptidase [Histomonas meleagridis]